MRGKKLLSLLLVLAMVLSLLPTVALPAFAASYELYVGGVQVTDDNKNDILGNGEAAYIPSSKTLTLYKSFSSSARCIYNYNVSGLTIKVAGSFVLRYGMTMLPL